MQDINRLWELNHIIMEYSIMKGLFSIMHSSCLEEEGIEGGTSCQSRTERRSCQDEKQA